MALWVRRTGAIFLAAALLAVSASIARSGGQQVVMGMHGNDGSEVEGNDGMEVDLSTLPRSAQMQDLAHVGGTAMGAGKGQYDALLDNGPLDPPRSSTIQKVLTHGLSMQSNSAPGTLPTLTQDSGVGGAKGGGIGIGGSIHLLRSAREILAGKMASELEGHPMSKQQAQKLAHARSRAPRVTMRQAQTARPVWEPKAQTSLEERAARLEAKVRKLEDAAGAAEISDLSGLSERD